MTAEHPHSDADGARGDGDRTRSAGADPLGRRTFLRRAAGAGAGAVGIGAVGVGGARAQEDTATTATQGTGEGDDSSPGITTKGALPADAPTFGNEDYTGFFIHIGGVNQNASTRNVSDCPFVGSDDAVVAYEAVLIDRVAENHPRVGTLLFSEVNNDTIAHGKLLVVTGQQSCGSGHVQVQLEEVGEARGTAEVGVQDEGIPDGNETGTADGNVTGTRMPGFGVGATVAGLVGAGELLRRRT